MHNTTAPTVVAPTTRRETARYVTAAAFVVVFVIGQYLLRSAGIPAHWWADLSWTLVSLLAGVECLRTARHITGEQRRAWLFFAAGCLMWFAGMLVWDYRELVQREFTPFPDYSDLGFMALAPLFVVGCMYMSSRRGTNLTLKDAADLGVVITVTAFGTWLVLAEPLRNPQLSVTYRGFAFLLPVLYLGAFVFALLATLRHVADPGRTALALILASLGLHAVTDSFYTYSLLEETYEAGHYLDVFWVIAFAMTYSAAVVQRRRGAHGDDEAPHVFNARMRRTDTLVFTGVLLLVGIVAFWRSDVLTQTPKPLGPFLALLAVFLGLREWANHRIQLNLIGGIRASERELSRILDSLDDTYYRTDQNGVVTRVSRSVIDLVGYRPDELIGRRISDLDADPDVAAHFSQALEANGGVIRNYESRLAARDGRLVWVSTNAHCVRDEAGNPIGVEGTSRDVSERKAAEEEMRKLSGALRQSADAVMITDAQGVIQYVNPAFEQTTGYASDEVVGGTPEVLKSGFHDRSYFERLWSMIGSGQVFRGVVVNRRKDGSLCYEDKTITPLMDDEGNVDHFVSTGKDISEQMQAQERLRYIAHHDTLTGLPNRALLLDRIPQVLAHARRHGRIAAVVFMDLDQFKNINDSLGHEVGDWLLVGVAERLSGEVRSGDTVARFGGDEFVILLDDLDSYGDVTQVVEKLREALQGPIVVDGMSLHVSATIGIAVYPNDGDDGPTLLKNADNAMYRAKESGRDTYAFYSQEMSTRAHERLTMENGLRRAVDHDELVVYYQPQIDIVDSRVVGVEALLRWHDPAGHSVGPAVFVPLLEETGLIMPVGERVLRTACTQVQQWNQGTGRHLELAVNISARQLTDSRFAEMVLDVLNETGLDCRLLQFEMTESIYLRTTDTSNAAIRTLNLAGIRLAIDDFGTGYSALNYLKRLPIQILKIDRSFIHDIPDDENDSALTVAALAMARALGLRVVAEGVETREQLIFLREHDCRYAQGFLFSKPLPAPEMEVLLRNPDY